MATPDAPAPDEQAPSEPESTREKKGQATKKPRRGLPTAVQIILGIGVGLALAEGMFWLRAGGAFPHLNVYAPDAALGVRLKPGESQRISFGQNPVTSVRVNASGFRGADFPPPGGGDEIMVVGDSQVFGLGVEEGEAFAAALERELKGSARVLNAGVPTWGPPEYTRITSELLAARKPKTVIYTINFVNDAFEANRPNTERHAVWDGWAVRKETAPLSITEFPGRQFLFGQSHAVFALRQFLHTKEPERDDRGFASEGTWKDLVGLGQGYAARESVAREETEARGRLKEARDRFAARAALAAELRVKLLAYNLLKLDGETSTVYLASHANPGDIVTPQQGEEGRPLAASVKYIQEAAGLRRKFEEELKKRAAAQAGTEESKEIESSLKERDSLEEQLALVLAEPVEIVRASNPLLQAVEEAKAVVEGAGARFVLLVLPIDVQVSPDEWKKYGREPMDLAGTEVLLRDLAEGTRDLGASALDATEVLRAAEPGAFLNGDPHMSPKGHEAVARALAKTLGEAPPKAKLQPLVTLPAGRSRLPRVGEWATLAGDVLVTGSDAAGCVTRRIREWLYVRCAQKEGSKSIPVAAKVSRGGHGEVMIWAAEKAVTMVAPTVRGDDFRATFYWNDRARDLGVRWPASDVVPTMGFEEAKLDVAGPPPAPSEEEGALARAACACADKRELAAKSGACWMAGSPEQECARTYGGDCGKLLECLEGRPTRPPRCAPGSVNAGAALHCYAACGDQAACPASQACVEKQGAKLCLDAAAKEGSTFAPPVDGADGIKQTKSKPAVVEENKTPDAERIKQHDALAHKAVQAMERALGSCKLEFLEPGDWFVFEFFDWCPWKEGDVPAASKATEELLALVKESPELEQGKRAEALAKIRMFRDWLELSARSKQSRGTLALFQEVAIAWNGYQADKTLHVAPDPAHIVKQYTEDFGHPHVNYISSSYGQFESRKKLGLPLPWMRGVHGPRLPNK